MVKSIVFDQVISGMKLELETLDEINVYEVEKKFEQCFTLLKAIVECPYSLTAHVAVQAEAEVCAAVEEVHMKKEAAESITERKRYRFERKLKGGFLPELKAVVPESEIRRLGIQHGDLLYADLKRAGDEYTAPRYEYSIAEGCGGDCPDRMELSYCIVEYDRLLGHFQVSRTNKGLIRINESPYSFILPPADVQQIGIQEGDVVDIAYLKSDPSQRRVIWKYSLGEEVGEATKPGVLKAAKEKKEKKEVEPVFQGKSILMLGNEPDKAEFKAIVEQRGGEFLFLSGDESKHTMCALIKKADVVVFMQQHMSHGAADLAKEICTKQGIKFIGTDSFGKTSFIRLVMEHFGSTEQ